MGKVYRNLLFVQCKCNVRVVCDFVIFFIGPEQFSPRKITSLSGCKLQYIYNFMGIVLPNNKFNI